ncbi:prenyltransferase [Natrinema ejinorense]|uniref:Prenyltransferase n=1 Tax=Natrinema ejinorense TaxID=373386 RepID=A0A2A5R048_9EURY|nr:prenyltransferase [Natrinema ejinorense]PCR92470.1 prenyltransferase [Natrinema ejinorense]
MSNVASGRSLADWELAPAVDYIERVQRSDGLIPWYPDGPADPWDHVESAMGLSVAERHEAARRAYRWIADAQHEDGSLWATYGEAEAGDGAHAGDEPRKETHRSAYVAVGVWHHYLCTGERAFLETLWPTVRDALEFACAQQAATGEIYWTVGADGEVYEDALVAGCASIYKSLACGAAIAAELGHTDARERWLAARADLGAAIRERPDRFDRTWESKSRYAMDWFYPVLCGVLGGDPARQRLEAGMDRYLEAGLGCRCVADEPWVTVAESCELVVSLAAVGEAERAREIYEWLFQWTDDEGVFWTGYQFEDEEFWPGERPTWTGGAAVLAADALSGVSPAADLFTDPLPERE